MANLSDDGEEGVSLFPMFNILACTLGVMVFVLATVATVSLGADKAVEFISADLLQGAEPRVPTWLEWDGRKLIMHPSLESVDFDQDLRRIRTYEATYSYVFDQLVGTPIGGELARVAQDRRRYIILLVRPSGFGSLPEVRGYLDLLRIDHVYEPIDQDWRRIKVR
jgi:hypothetical protein